MVRKSNKPDPINEPSSQQTDASDVDGHAETEEKLDWSNGDDDLEDHNIHTVDANDDSHNDPGANLLNKGSTAGSPVAPHLLLRGGGTKSLALRIPKEPAISSKAKGKAKEKIAEASKEESLEQVERELQQNLELQMAKKSGLGPAEESIQQKFNLQSWDINDTDTPLRNDINLAQRIANALVRLDEQETRCTARETATARTFQGYLKLIRSVSLTELSSNAEFVDVRDAARSSSREMAEMKKKIELLETRVRALTLSQETMDVLLQKALLNARGSVDSTTDGPSPSKATTSSVALSSPPAIPTAPRKRPASPQQDVADKKMRSETPRTRASHLVVYVGPLNVDGRNIWSVSRHVVTAVMGTSDANAGLFSAAVPSGYVDRIMALEFRSREQAKGFLSAFRNGAPRFLPSNTVAFLGDDQVDWNMLDRKPTLSRDQMEEGTSRGYRDDYSGRPYASNSHFDSDSRRYG